MTPELSDLLGESAVDVQARLRGGSVQSEDLLTLLEGHHDSVDATLNALPTTCFARARGAAVRAGTLAPLHGMPVVVKDLTAVAGVRTTYGSPIYRDNMPTESDFVVERIEASGGLPYAKSNTPEFGCGGVTFNDVLGETRNPWNPAYTPGGSSGGSAAALASGQAWLALGSDFGGSLRLPASFCGIVGLRPTPGCVPRGPSAVPFDRHWVEGPMGRSVADVALLLDALVGQDRRDPLSTPREAGFLQAVDRPTDRVRIASVGGLGLGALDPVVEQAVNEALGKLDTLPDWEVMDRQLDLAAAREVFAVRRGLCYAAMFESFRRDSPELLRPDIISDLDRGLGFDATTIARADRLQGELWKVAEIVFRDADILACPTVVVPPFKAGQPSIAEVAGEALPTYYDWLRLTYSVSLIGVPAISIPCGFSPDGLPIGLQLMAPPHREARLLQVAAAAESRLDVFADVSAPWQRRA